MTVLHPCPLPAKKCALQHHPRLQQHCWVCNAIIQGLQLHPFPVPFSSLSTTLEALGGSGARAAPPTEPTSSVHPAWGSCRAHTLQLSQGCDSSTWCWSLLENHLPPLCRKPQRFHPKEIPAVPAGNPTSSKNPFLHKSTMLRAVHSQPSQLLAMDNPGGPWSKSQTSKVGKAHPKQLTGMATMGRAQPWPVHANTLRHAEWSEPSPGHPKPASQDTQSGQSRALAIPCQFPGMPMMVRVQSWPHHANTLRHPEWTEPSPGHPTPAHRDAHNGRSPALATPHQLPGMPTMDTAQPWPPQISSQGCP